MNIRSLFLLCGIVFGAMGCGGDDTSDGSTGGACPSDNPGSGAATFRADVLPIFKRSCSVGGASCHGSPSGPIDQPYLGPDGLDANDMDIEQIFASILTPAVREPGMQVVDRGKPQTSFLMHKMDGLCSANLSCKSDNTCGLPMPQTSPEPLALNERDLIRAWIQAGANND